MECYQIYNKDSLKIDELSDYDYIFCPKSECIGNVVEIDELFVPIIIELNKKGYSTKFCCSGHYYGNCPNAYIMFESDIELPNIPKGYTQEIDDNNCVTIRRMFVKETDYQEEYIDTYKYYDNIINNAKQTLKWAKDLPPLDI